MRLILLVPVVGLLTAQSARVVVLSDLDAAQAADTWRDLRQAEARWEAVKSRIKSKYRLEWEPEFSEDFHAVVPDRTRARDARLPENLCSSPTFDSKGKLTCAPTQP